MLATTFGRDISIAQMTVSLYMVGIALSQLIMGPLSDRFGRRPVLLGGLALMVAASIACIFAETLPQLIAARFFQALGGASGMVVSRAIIRDIYERDRVASMISLVVAALMIGQMVSPLTGGLIETAFGWRAIFYAVTVGAIAVAVGIAIALPETRRDRAVGSGGFRSDVGTLIESRAFIGYVMCQVLASQIIFTFAGGGPYIVVTQMGRTSAEYGAWFADDRLCISRRQSALRALRAATLAGKADLVRARPATLRQPVEPALEFHRLERGAGLAVRHADDRDGRQCLRDGELRRRRHQRPP